MTKKSKQVAYGEASARLRAEVDFLLKEVDRHNFYAARLYAAHNEVKGLNEETSNCASCLRSRARNLREWRANGKKATAATKLTDEEVTGIVVALLEGAGVDGDTQPAQVLEVVKHQLKGEHHAQVIAKLQEGEKELTAQLAQQEEDAGRYDRWREDAAALGLTADSTTEEVKAGFAKLGNAEGVTDEQRGYYGGLETAALASLTEQHKPHDLPNTSIELADGSFIVFTPNEGVKFGHGAKGSVLTGDGGNVKAGTYDTKSGDQLKVQIGGKATFNVNPLS